MSEKKISTKATIHTAEEIGRWYDEHSATEVESEPVDVKVDRKYDPTFTMRIPQEALQRLKAMADEQGVPTTTMARILLLGALDRAADPLREALAVLTAVAENAHLREALKALVGAGDERDVERARSLLRDAG